MTLSNISILELLFFQYFFIIENFSEYAEKVLKLAKIPNSRFVDSAFVNLYFVNHTFKI